MGRDTIQLEDAVSTISEEYLLEFTSEYGIPESLHPELPGPEEPIVEFPEGKVGVYTKFFEFANYLIGAAKVDERIFPTVVEWRTSAPKYKKPSADSYSATEVTILNTHRTPIQKQPELLLCLVGLSRSYFMGDDVYPTFLYDDDRDMDLFNLISTLNPAKVKTETRPRAAYEVPLLTVTVSRMIEMEDTVVASGSSGTPFDLEKLPLNFANEDPPQMITEMGGTTDQVQDGLSHEISPVETATTTEEGSCCLPPCTEYPGGKSLALIGLEAGSTFFTPAIQETPADAKSVSDLESLSYAKPQLHPEQDIFQEDGPRDPYQKCCYREGARSALHRKSEVKEIDLCPIRGRVARKYLPAGMGRDQQLQPGYPERMLRHGRSHSANGVLL
ncbi:hypothetical protein Tco_0386401 [Tanacetum coccineum]